MSFTFIALGIIIFADLHLILKIFLFTSRTFGSLELLTRELSNAMSEIRDGNKTQLNHNGRELLSKDRELNLNDLKLIFVFNL